MDSQRNKPGSKEDGLLLLPMTLSLIILHVVFQSHDTLTIHSAGIQTLSCGSYVKVTTRQSVVLHNPPTSSNKLITACARAS